MSCIGPGAVSPTVTAVFVQLQLLSTLPGWIGVWQGWQRDLNRPAEIQFGWKGGQFADRTHMLVLQQMPFPISQHVLNVIVQHLQQGVELV